MTKRRSIPWVEVAEMARSNPGVWRLHRSLITVTPDLMRHARRRVRALRPTDAGRFDLRPRNQTPDLLGKPVLDLYVRYTPTEGTDHAEEHPRHPA